jgi:hypothetical protein
MAYNMGFLDTSTNFLDILTGVNNTTDGYLAGFMLLVIGLVVFLAMKSKNYDTEVVILADGFLLSVLGLFMYTMEIISMEIFVMPIVILLIGIFLNVINKNAK